MKEVNSVFFFVGEFCTLECVNSVSVIVFV